jgi:hypothetical protein
MPVDQLPGTRDTVPHDDTRPPARWRRFAPVVALMVLAPWTAECSWGGFTVGGFLFIVIILAPMYGGAAVLIRETTRHIGGGWPVMILLAAAFGFLQAGLVDQSLFNHAYLDDTEFAASAAAAQTTLVPGLGFSAGQALDYVGGHIALSMCAPIVIVESFLVPRRRHEVWLGGRGLTVIAVVYLLGSLLIFADDSGRKNFLASPLQLTFAVVVVAGLIGTAMLPRWRRSRPYRPGAAPAPHPIWVGLTALGAHLSALAASGWPAIGLRVAAVVVAATVIITWSRRVGWGHRHVLAAWAAGLVAAAGGAYFVPNYYPASPGSALVGDIAITVITLALVGGAFWRVHRTLPQLSPRRGRSAPPVPGC